MIADKLQIIIANNTAIKEHVADSLAAVAAKGVDVPDGSKVENLPTLIESIETGVGGGTTPTYEPSRFYLNKCVLTIDNGYQIERIPIHPGDVIDLGEGQDVEASTNWGEYYHAKSHPAMTFQEWASSIEIVNNQFVVPDDLYIDYHVGAIYSTADNLVHCIEITADGYQQRSYDSTSANEADNDSLTAIWVGQNVSFMKVNSKRLTDLNLPLVNLNHWDLILIGLNSLQYLNVPSGVKNFQLSSASLTSFNISHLTSKLPQNYACQRIQGIEYPAVQNLPMKTVWDGALRTLVLPASITSITSWAFSSANYGLNLIVMLGSTPPNLGDTSISICAGAILVPIGSGEAYKNATNWSAVSDMIVENTEENRKKFGIW